MKRKTSEAGSRIWTYGCLEPDAAAREKLFDLLHRSHRYYNGLVGLELDRRAKIFGLGSLAPEELETLKSDESRFRALVDAACAASGGRRGASGMYAPRTVGSAKPGVLVACLADPSFSDRWKDRARVAAGHSAACVALRNESGLPPGTYLLVNKAFEAACKAPGGPKRKPWDPSGRVGVQTRRDLVETAFDGTCLAVSFGERSPDMKPSGGRPDRLAVQMRVGPGSEIVSLACVVHRRPPPGSVLTGAWILVERIGPRFVFKIQLVIESASFSDAPADDALPSVAVDLGWRLMPDGSVRTACWADSSGRSGTVAVPPSVLSALSHCSSLDSIRDRVFNSVLALTVRWLRFSGPALPDSEPSGRRSLRDYASYASAWRSPKRLTVFVRRLVSELGQSDAVRTAWDAWRTHRLASKLDLMASYTSVRKWLASSGLSVDPFFLFLEAWRHKNKHLYDWSESRRSSAYGLRDDSFHREAARMASEYGRIAFENFDLRAFARDALPDEDSGPDRHHRIRNVASPGRFRALVLSAAGKLKVRDEEMANSTRECHLCGFKDQKWDRPQDLVQTCSGCGESWDQDMNAARILLRRMCERSDGTASPVTARRASRPRKKPVHTHSQDSVV